MDAIDATVSSVHTAPLRVRIAPGAGGRGARDVGDIQRAGDPGDAVPSEALGEHLPHDQRGARTGLQSVRAAPLGVGLFRSGPASASR
jgi:hypothetical protein